MNNESVLFELLPDGIGVITLNRAHRHNAFDDQIIMQLKKILLKIKTDDQVKVIMLTANGENFSAGADLDWMKKMIHYSEQENLEDALQLAQLLKLLSSIEKPTIALAVGASLGGGVGLLACCDIVIAEENAKFCFSESKLGLVPATIAPYVIQAIGARLAKYYFLTAKTFTASDAKEMGLVQELCSKDKLLSTGIDVASLLLKNGPKSFGIIKKLISDFNLIDDESMEKTAALIASVRTSEEAQEGLNAFFEKRQPKWITK